MNVKFTATKSSNEHTVSSELICIAGTEICSGGLFTEDSWKKYINKNLLHYSELPSKNFSDQIVHHELQNKKEKLFATQVLIDFQNISQTYGKDISQLLFKEEKSQGDPSIYFVVADDIFVDINSDLTIELVYKECTENRISWNKF